MNRFIALIAVSLLAFAGVARAEKAAAADPNKFKSDPEFNIQGEYIGEMTNEQGETFKAGAQVIALGDGKFSIIGYPGGLPGDGWSKGMETHHAEGQLENGVAVFHAQNADVQIKDNVATVTNREGKTIITMKKTIRKSPTEGAKPPEGAKVLFGGNGQNDFPADKVTEDGLLMQGSNSKSRFQSCTLHLEFRLPFEPKGRGQGRGNSGCYPQGRYEVQILDSFGLEGKNNECGGIYTVSDPLVNMCYPPLQWQTYDIDFTAAQFDETGKKVKNARMTVRHNGVLVQNDVEIPNTTTAAPVKEGPEPSYLHLQDHGHPVRFQNIWIVEKK